MQLVLGRENKPKQLIVKTTCLKIYKTWRQERLIFN